MCFDDQMLSTYLDGELTEPWKSQVEEHLSYCQACKGRLESLKKLDVKIQQAVLSDEEIKISQDKVLTSLEKKCLNKKTSKLKLLNRKFRVSILETMGAAAAFVIIFVGSWSIFGNHNGNVIDAPIADNPVDVSTITPVSNKSLDKFSVEEIMSYLDSKGYDVTITLKGIQPLD